MSIMCFCEGDTAPACQYAQAYKMSPVQEPAALQTRLDDWWGTACEAERRERTVAPSTRETTLAAERAKKFLTETRLHRFVESANFNLGVAPTSKTVLTEVLRLQGASAEPAACLVRAASKRKHQLQKLRRWRQRNQVGFGRIAALETEPLDVARAKAAFCE